MIKPAVHAKKGQGFHAPRFSKNMFSFVGFVGPLYSRFAQGIAGIDVHNMEPLYKAYRDFQQKRTRLIILFRHGSKADGPVVLQTVVKELQKWCRKTGNRLPETPHTHFLYGKDVLNWAGFLARWAFPGIGGVPVVNGRMEKESHSVIRKLLIDGRFPLSFAPEGQVTYHTYRIFPFAPGTTKLAAWTHHDLRKAGRDESVCVLPMSITYRYAKNIENLLKKIIGMLDRATGLRGMSVDDPRQALLETTGFLIDTLENAYSTGYPRIVDFKAGLDLEDRVGRLCDMILKCHEALLGYTPKGETIDRVFRVRYWVMDSLHRDDVEPETLIPVERSLADHRALVATAADQHQQIVDLLEYIRPDYIHPECSTTRLAEYGMNLLDLCNRIAGGNVDTRYRPRKITARVIFGEPVDASAFFERPGGTSRAKLQMLDSELSERFNGMVGQLEARYG